MEKGEVKMLIQTPNARNKCGFNTDRYVFDPTCTSLKDLKHLKFVGILFGVAMRTRKPLDLHLAQPIWKMLAGMKLTSEDLEEVLSMTRLQLESASLLPFKSLDYLIHCWLSHIYLKSR